MRKKSFLVISILLLILLFIGYNMYNKEVDKVADLKTDQKVEAKTLLTEFESDELAANKLYLDKTIEVSGMVTKVEENEGITSVYLASEEGLSAVICQMEEAVNVAVGSEIVVKGVCSGYLMDVIMVRCIIL
ncbi:MAG TPA: hypothetical protein PLY70_16475 [Saprospiraceae bacterium]|nr:hypothetical protein [Saprospiraceae bacterium]HPN71672.1 hypothetical protein [Saprospiraceae bacterium]